MKKTILSMLLAVPLTAGCISVSLVGGRHQSTSVYWSDFARARSEMAAASETSDFLRDNVLSSPASAAEAAAVAAKVAKEKGEIALDDEKAEAPVIGGTLPLPEGYLWKPISNTGNLRFLTNADLEVVSVSVGTTDPEIGTLNVSEEHPDGRANPLATDARGRQHWNFNYPGAHYGQNVLVTVTDEDGITYHLRVPDGADRHGLP